MADFKATQTFGIHLEIDQNNRLIRLSKTDEVFSIDDLTDCEIVVEQGKIGRGTFAWSFSATLPGSGVFSASKLAVRFHLKDGTHRDLDLLLTTMKSSNLAYKNLDKTAHEIYDAVKPLIATSQAAASDEPAYMQELRQLKKLLDEGIITQQDYDAKKAELLKL